MAIANLESQSLADTQEKQNSITPESTDMADQAIKRREALPKDERKHPKEHLDYGKIQTHSNTDRNTYWENRKSTDNKQAAEKGTNLEEVQMQEWVNSNLQYFLEKTLNSQNPEEINALASVGITISKNDLENTRVAWEVYKINNQEPSFANFRTEKSSISTALTTVEKDLRKFHTDYGDTKEGVKKFIQDIAADCVNDLPQKEFNYAKFNKRLLGLDAFLGNFGQDEVKKEIANCLRAYVQLEITAAATEPREQPSKRSDTDLAKPVDQATKEADKKEKAIALNKALLDIKEEIKKKRDAGIISKTQSYETGDYLYWQEIKFDEKRTKSSDEAYRGYLMIEPEDFPQVLRLLLQIGEKRIKENKDLNFKWVQNTYPDKKLIMGADSKRIGQYEQLEKDDPRIALYADTPEEIQEILNELVKQPEWKDIEKRRNEQSDMGDGKAPRRPGTNLVVYDGQEYRSLNYNNHPGYSEDEAADPNWRNNKVGKPTILVS